MSERKVLPNKQVNDYPDYADRFIREYIMEKQNDA